MRWREAWGVLNDERIPMRLKRKFYRSIVRPTILYNSECWGVNRRIELNTSVAEVRILKWISCVMREDRKTNEYLRGSVDSGQYEIEDWDGLGMWWSERKQKQ